MSVYWKLKKMNTKDYDFSFRPTRCPSLTCRDWPAAALVSAHIDQQHDGTVPGKDVVVRTGTNHLISSYVNVDRNRTHLGSLHSCSVICKVFVNSQNKARLIFREHS